MQDQLRRNFTNLVAALVCVMLGLIVFSLLLASRVQAAPGEELLTAPAVISTAVEPGGSRL